MELLGARRLPSVAIPIDPIGIGGHFVADLSGQPVLIFLADERDNGEFTWLCAPMSEDSLIDLLSGHLSFYSALQRFMVARLDGRPNDLEATRIPQDGFDVELLPSELSFRSMPSDTIFRAMRLFDSRKSGGDSIYIRHRIEEAFLGPEEVAKSISGVAGIPEEIGKLHSLLDFKARVKTKRAASFVFEIEINHDRVNEETDARHSDTLYDKLEETLTLLGSGAPEPETDGGDNEPPTIASVEPREQERESTSSSEISVSENLSNQGSGEDSSSKLLTDFDSSEALRNSILKVVQVAKKTKASVDIGLVREVVTEDHSILPKIAVKAVSLSLQQSKKWVRAIRRINNIESTHTDYFGLTGAFRQVADVASGKFLFHLSVESRLEYPDIPLSMSGIIGQDLRNDFARITPGTFVKANLRHSGMRAKKWEVLSFEVVEIGDNTDTRIAFEEENSDA